MSRSTSPGGRWTGCRTPAPTRSVRWPTQRDGCWAASCRSVAGAEVQRGLTELAAVGLTVRQVESCGRGDALEVAAGAFQPRVALEQRPEVRPVPGRQQMGQLVQDHVV